jgi:hypothetical protein
MDNIQVDINIKETFSTKIGTISLRHDGIIVFSPHQGITNVDMESMVYNLDKFIEWSKDKPLPFLSDNRNIKQISPEVREFVQSKLPVFCSKHAIIVNTGLSQFLFNLFLHLNRPEIPIKSFSNINKAYAWLKEG